MAILTEREYEEYIQLLKAWMDAQRALEGVEDEVDPQARERVRAAHATVQSFRSAHGLDGEPALAEGKR